MLIKCSPHWEWPGPGQVGGGVEQGMCSVVRAVLRGARWARRRQGPPACSAHEVECAPACLPRAILGMTQSPLSTACVDGRAGEWPHTGTPRALVRNRSLAYYQGLNLDLHMPGSRSLPSFIPGLCFAEVAVWLVLHARGLLVGGSQGRCSARMDPGVGEACILPS